MSSAESGFQIGDLDRCRDVDAVRETYETVDEALKVMDPSDDREAWLDLQGLLFDLKAAERARDPEFQQISLEGTRVTTSRGTARVLDGMQVCEPENPHITHAVTIDHEISGEGEVTCEVNAVPVDEVGTREGSHIR